MIEEIEQIQFSDFERNSLEYITRNKPIIIQNALPGNIVFSLTPDLLKKRAGNTLVSASYSKTNIFSSSGGKKLIQMKLGDYINEKMGDPNYYLQQASIPEQFPALFNEISSQDLIKKELITDMNLWISSASSVTPLHYDIYNNFFIQCYGKKTFILFEADQMNYLYPYDIKKHTHPHVSQVNIEKPDLSLHPKYENATSKRITLNSGEILYIPSSTWHHVTSISNSISVNIWFNFFDFQFLQPTITKFIRHTQPTLATWLQSAVPHTFKNTFELCDKLFEISLYIESVLCYIAILESGLQSIYSKNVTSSPPSNRHDPANPFSDAIELCDILEKRTLITEAFSTKAKRVFLMAAALLLKENTAYNLDKEAYLVSKQAKQLIVEFKHDDQK